MVVLMVCVWGSWTAGLMVVRWVHSMAPERVGSWANSTVGTTDCLMAACWERYWVAWWARLWVDLMVDNWESLLVG